MLRGILSLLLLAGAGSAAAAWERAGATEDGATIYTDPATRQMAGDVVKMWTLMDYKAPEQDPNGKPYSSVKLMQEFDCKAAKGRTRYYSLHSGQMGAGQIVGSELRVDGEWLPANRARPGEILWQAACSKSTNSK